jgi:hypothetical protein
MPRKAVIPTKKTETVSRSLDDVQDNNAHISARDAKRDERLSEELMYGKTAYKRTARDTMQEKELRQARLHSFGGGPSDVQLFWDLGPEAIAKQLVKLRVGGQEVVLSAVELQKYLRWV